MTASAFRSLSVIVLAGLAACQTYPHPEGADWISSLSGADIIILGETHDNAQHHSIQAEVIHRVEPDAVIFEMVPITKTEVADAARARGTDLREALGWDESGWPDWEIYEPVFDAASSSRIVGAGVARDDVHRSMKEGAQSVSNLPPDYGLGESLSQKDTEDLTQMFIDSHCGMITSETARSMIEAQRLRDAVFAMRTLEAHALSPGPAPVVLITGTGHARKDRGVPGVLQQVMPNASVVVVGLLEQGSGLDSSLFDIVQVTKPSEREDPCAAFQRD